MHSTAAFDTPTPNRGAGAGGALGGDGLTAGVLLNCNGDIVFGADVLLAGVGGFVGGPNAMDPTRLLVGATGLGGAS